MIIEEISNFDSCDDLVSTEEIIWNNLEKENPQINNKYLFIKFPFADLINKNNSNVSLINPFLQSLRDRFPITQTLIFICQHIAVVKLILPPNCILFTPHATDRDSYIGLPHFTPFTPIKKAVSLENRHHLFCFHGASYTHPTRKKILDYYDDNPQFNLMDTGKWHFDKDPVSRIDRQERYSSTLSNSLFSLCPRGTGPSTIRIWDSLALGSVPVIIADGLKMPLPNKVRWNDCCIFVPEADIESLPDLVPPRTSADSMIKYGSEIYHQFFSKTNLHRTIISSLQ